MRVPLLAFVALLAALPAQGNPDGDKDQVLFGWEDDTPEKDWVSVRLPELERDQPSPKAEVAGKALKITFDGGEWPALGTTKIPVPGTWKPFQTLKADLTVDRAAIAYFRVNQGKPDDKSRQPHWERTMNLLPGPNEITLLIRAGVGSMDPSKGEVTSFVIGMFRPEKGQTLRIGPVRLSPDWPAPKVLGWTSPYNHDGYSAAVAREYQRTGSLTKFKVLGTDWEVSDLPDLAKRLKDRWVKPAPKTIDEVESEFRAELEKLKGEHPQATLAILREGEKGWSPASPDSVYQGWKYVYINCHGPDGPNRGREQTPAPSDTVETFMRHRSPLLRVDLDALPKGVRILASRFVITRSGAAALKVPEKPNLWVAEPCNREWDPGSANCYSYAPGKNWKGVSGMYYGEDPDFWPVFLMHGPAGGGAVTVWDFTEAVKFWLEDKHPNRGFFLYGDSNDYMRMFTPRAANLKQRPAVLVIYEPK